MFFNKSAALMTSLGLAILLAGCAKQSEKDLLAETQFCLDDAQDSTAVQNCVSKIEGINNKQAYTLRCAAGFIASGITQPEKLSTALNSMKDGGSTAGVLGILAFEDQTLANETFNQCTLAEDSGLSLISAMAKTATVINNFASGSGSLESQIQTGITKILDDLTNGTPEEQEAAIANLANVGGTIQTVYQTTCGGAVSVNTDICGSIDGAIATAPGGIDIVNSTPDEIGQALLEYWQNTNH